MGLRMHMRVDTSAVVRVQVSVRCKARRRTKRLGEREIFSDAIYSYVCIYVYVYMYVCICVCVCLFVCVRVCVCIPPSTPLPRVRGG